VDWDNLPKSGDKLGKRVLGTKKRFGKITTRQTMIFSSDKKVTLSPIMKSW